MSPHHILHILGTAQPEAAGKVRIVGAIASGLDPAQFKVHAWFLGADGPLVAELEQSGATVRVVPWQGGRRDPIGMWRFWRVFQKRRFTILHQHEGGRAIRWIVRATQGTRVLVHLHGRVLEAQANELIDPNIQAADFVIATSLAVAERAKGAKVAVVYPGVPVAENLAENPTRTTGNTRVVGTAGRLVPVKGIAQLIRAVCLLRSRIPDVRLEIAGSGPEESALREEVQRLELNGCVAFLGWQSNLAPLFARWNVFVLPSIEEAFGVAALEAMAAGLPVVATDVGGIPELVENGKTGWLVPPGDPVALSERLGTLLLDAQQQQMAGTAGWIRAREKFSQEHMVYSVARIYKELLASR